jgi:hypothetical protein
MKIIFAMAENPFRLSTSMQFDCRLIASASSSLRYRAEDMSASSSAFHGSALAARIAAMASRETRAFALLALVSRGLAVQIRFPRGCERQPYLNSGLLCPTSII